MYFTELSCTARLLLVTVVCTGHLGDGLAIGYAGRLKLDGYLVIVFQTPLQRTQMEFSLSANDGLTQFLALLNNPSRILLMHTEKCGHEFFGVCGIDGLDSTGEFRVGILDEIKLPLTILAVERIAGLHILEFHRTTDVAGIELVYWHAVGSSTGIDLPDTLLRTAVCIGQIVSGLDTTAHHLEVTYFSDMRFETCLEEIYRLGTGSVGRDFLTARIVQFRHFADEGYHIAQELHQSAYAHILSCAYAKYREDAPGDQALADTLTQFVFRERLFLKEFLHERLVILCCGFYKCLVQFHGLVHLFGRYVLNDRHTTFGLPRIFLHEQHVYQSIEARTSLYGVLYLHAFGAVDGLHIGNDVVEVALVGVQLVDEEDDRFFQFLGIPEIVLCADLRSVLSIDEDDCLVGNIEGRDGTADEIVRSRAVYDIEFLVVPFYVEYRREHRIAIFLFNREVVAHRVLCLHRTAALDDTTSVKHRLGKGGLAGTRTAQQCDVLDFVGLIDSHIIRY